MIAWIKHLLMRCFVYETSPSQLALAAAFSVYVSFSPFLGFHTLMVIGAGFIFRLNIPLMLLIGYGINNPFTMIPVYMSGYLVGYWVLHSFLYINIVQANPWWMHSINSFLYYHLGMTDISFWAFMLGGNLLGVVLACLSYIVLLPLFVKLSKQRYHQ